MEKEIVSHNKPIASFNVINAAGVSMGGKYEVFQRTFEAKKFPTGSEERKKLNLDNVTSEYMPSHKYSIKGFALSITYTTKREAMDAAEKFSGVTAFRPGKAVPDTENNNVKQYKSYYKK